LADAESWFAERRFRVVSVARVRVRPESGATVRGAGAGWRRGCCCATAAVGAIARARTPAAARVWRV